MKNLLYLFLFVFPAKIVAQKIDNLASFREFEADGYFRFNYDNDVFYSKDEDYTQGYNLELVCPGLRHNPVNILFVKPKNSEQHFGIAVEHIGYTPYNIKEYEIQYGDRPFASAIMLKSFSMATDTIRKSRWVSSLSLGIIGQGAFGEDMQIGFHELIGNTIPQGWHNQIRNDAVVNYEIGYEKQLIGTNWFSLQSNATLRLGTLFTNTSVGLTTTIGKINMPFIGSASKRKFLCYAYAQPLLNFIGYDATLQGGLFNRSSPYTISNSAIERVTAQTTWGIILQLDNAYLEYTITSISREFDTGRNSGWGGFRIGISF